MAFVYLNVFLYSEANYGGTKTELTSPYGNLSLTVKSIFVPAYVNLTLFDSDSYGGNKKILTSSVSDTTSGSLFPSGSNDMKTYIVQNSMVPYFVKGIESDLTKKVSLYNVPLLSEYGSILYQNTAGIYTDLNITGTRSILIPEGTYITLTDDNKNTLEFYHSVYDLSSFISSGTFAKITSITISTLCAKIECAKCEKCEKCKISNKVYDFLGSKTFFIILGLGILVIVFLIYLINEITVNKQLKKAAAKKS
jgi:hypothetical protein